MHPCPDVPSTDTGSFLLRLANLVHAVLLAREAAQLWQLPMMEDCLVQSSVSSRCNAPGNECADTLSSSARAEDPTVLLGNVNVA